MTREESLINELRHVAFEDGESIERRQAELIALFIIGREKLLLDKIGKPLKDMKDVNDRFELAWGTCLEHKAIDEALAIIEKEGL